MPFKRVPTIDIAIAIIINFLFEISNFFKIPLKIKDKPANAKISTQNSINPPAILKGLGLIERALTTK